jgi:hypothetical protein
LPPVSQSQRRWAFANRDKNPAAAEFAAVDHGGKLPARVKNGKPSGRHADEHAIADKIIKRLNARGRK